MTGWDAMDLAGAYPGVSGLQTLLETKRGFKVYVAFRRLPHRRRARPVTIDVERGDTVHTVAWRIRDELCGRGGAR
jgi:hypothetical protein